MSHHSERLAVELLKVGLDAWGDRRKHRAAPRVTQKAKAARWTQTRAWDIALRMFIWLVMASIFYLVFRHAY
jgi:hypothetical protein